jgi:predicted flavoprotein YhiN
MKPEGCFMMVLGHGPYGMLCAINNKKQSLSEVLKLDAGSEHLDQIKALFDSIF